MFKPQLLIAFALLLGACSKPPAEVPEEKKTAVAAPTGHQGCTHLASPHGGTLVLLSGNVAHLEFVLDGATGALTAYVLDVNAEPTVAAEETIVVSCKRGFVTFELTLSGAEKADAGFSSYKGVAEELKGVTDFDGTLIKLTVNGKTAENSEFGFPAGNAGHCGH